MYFLRGDIVSWSYSIYVEKKFIRIKLPDFNISGITTSTLFLDFPREEVLPADAPIGNTHLLFPIEDNPSIYKYTTTDNYIRYYNTTYDPLYFGINTTLTTLNIIQTGIKIEQTHQLLRLIFEQLIRIKRNFLNPDSSFVYLDQYNLDCFGNYSVTDWEEIASMIYLENLIERGENM